MIPRLQPRPSLRRQPGIENVFPTDANTNVSENSLSDETDAPINPVSASSGRLELHDRSSATSKEEVQPSKAVAPLDRPPLSPSNSPLPAEQSTNSPVPSHYGNEFRYLLLNQSSSLSNALGTEDSSMSYYDFSLTPPTGSRPPLLVSAKRYGSEVRRQHSKRRRRRRRPSSTTVDSQTQRSLPQSSVGTEGTASCKQIDEDALCLWKGECYGEAEDNHLPLLASSDEEEEQTDRIEELVRAEHLKEAKVARGNNKIHFNHRPFSANRAPPPKGCLSNPRPKRRRGDATRYKTPPKSSDELDAFSELNVSQSRRVQFGIPSAVEYEIDRPSGHLTPMSQEVTRKRYSMDPKESTQDEEKITNETKQNNLILSKWEDHFSSTNQCSDGSRRTSSSWKRSRRNRRSSSIFSPANRTSLVSCNSDQTNDDVKGKKDENQSHNPLDRISLGSPSAVVATKYSSRNMLQPQNSLDGTCDGPISQATPTSTAGRVEENRTWNFVADLGSINSKGAMELSPNPSSSGITESMFGGCTRTITNPSGLMIHEENTQPPPAIAIDTVKIFGGTVDNNATNGGDVLQQDVSNRDYSTSSCVWVSPKKSTNLICKTLIDTPWLDQEWDFPTVLRNLSFLTRKDDLNIYRCFNLIDPRVSNGLYRTNHQIDRLLRELSSQSSFPYHPLNGNNHSSAKSVIMTEWNEIEISFIEDLTKQLNGVRLEIEKRSNFDNTIKNLFPSKDSSLHSPRGNKQIQEEISELENEINQCKSSLDVSEASSAPYACIFCQATAQLGIYGFLLEEFRGDNILKLNFMHAIFSVKTHVVVDIDSDPRIKIEQYRTTSKKENCCVFDYHRGYLNMLVAGNISFEINCVELQDSLLKLGTCLGKLDQSALAFKVINDGRKATVAFDLPHIRLTIPANHTVVSMTLDMNSFVTKTISVSKRGGSSSNGETIEVLSSVDCCDLRALSEIIDEHT